MTKKEKGLIPFGRLSELTKRVDADLLLVTPFHPAGSDVMADDYQVIRFDTRSSLEAFFRTSTSSKLRAVVHTIVPPGCAVWAYEREVARV